MSNLVFPALIDSGVVVAWARGHPPATMFFLARNSLGAPDIGRLSAMEMLVSCQSDADRGITLRLISHMTILELTDTIAKHAYDLLTTIPLPTPLTPSDAIIAATAIEHSLPLYTLDPTRFANLSGLATIQPY